MFVASLSVSTEHAINNLWFSFEVFDHIGYIKVGRMVVFKTAVLLSQLEVYDDSFNFEIFINFTNKK